MSLDELRLAWDEWCNHHDYDDYKEMVNDFCNMYATSYEEYMTLWEMLMDEEETDPAEEYEPYDCYPDGERKYN